MKKALLFICTIALVFGVFFAADIEPAQAASNIKITVNGQTINTGSTKPFSDSHNRVMVPMRALSNALGAQIEYVPNVGAHALNWIIIQKTYGYNNKCVALEFHNNSHGSNSWSQRMDYVSGYGKYINGSSVGYYGGDIDYNYDFDSVNESEVYMDTAPVFKNGSGYLPARYVANYLGYSVTWNAQTKTVGITKNGSSWCWQ